MTNQYWIVGATFDNEDALPDFLEKGYWYCWPPKKEMEPAGPGHSVGTQQRRFKKIKKGDRIAVKSGQTSQRVNIRAFGIVKAVDFDEWRVYVNWITENGFSRMVENKGYGASIHGPYKFTDEGINEIFCI